MSLAAFIAEANVVRVSVDQPFTWSSGVQCPVYVDHRALISEVDLRHHVTVLLASEARRLRPHQAVAGVATAAVPWAAWVAEAMSLPLLYVRKAEKGYGLGRAVEGGNPIGEVLIIDDVFTTGGSTIRAAEALRDRGLSVKAALSIMDYECPLLEQNMLRAELEYSSLYRFSELLGEMERRCAFTKEELDEVSRWHGRFRSGSDGSDY